MSRHFRLLAAFVPLVILLPITTGSLSAQQRPTLTPADYAQWENLGAFQLDPLGQWVVTSISRTDRSVELRLRRADGSVEEKIFEHGSRAAFSPDGRWLAWAQGVSQEERDDADGSVRDRLGLMDLQSGQDTVLMPMRSFAFRDDGEWLAVLGHPVADSVGADLLVIRPGGAEQTLMGNVDEFGWQDDGPHMAVTLKTAWGSANGVALLDPDAGTVRTLDSRDAEYGTLTWDEESARLGVFRSSDVDGMEEETLDLLVWDDVTARAQPQSLLAANRPEFGDSLRVTDFSGFGFRNEGRSVAFGVRPWTAEPADDDDSDGAGDDDDSDSTANEDTDSALPEMDPADVQVWHWDDDAIIRAQEYGSARIARQTHSTVWNRDDDSVIVLGEDLDESVRLIGDAEWALRPDYSPYLVERRFGSSAADWYRVNARTGESVLIATGLQGVPSANPDGTRLMLFEDDHWVAVDVATLERTAIDPNGQIEVLQTLFDYDYPGPRPSWGIGGWGSKGETVYIYDRHDVWLADLGDGSVERLTHGADANLEYRIRNMDPEASFGPAELNGGEDVWYNLRNTRTKASGYARGRGADVETLLLQEARVASLSRAIDADVFALRMERWDDSPDVFTAGRDLDDLTQMTRTNPFQDDYAWGHSELIQYTTDAGHELQGILAYPADFQEGRQYPLILYQYERLSDGLHSYQVPDERRYYNYQAWSQAGYFVLMPDIVYEPGRPGPSALDAVENALDAAVATGHVDPEGMGLIGHSWGGYQAAYLPTRTNRFAASVAGAAITDFISFMGAVHWNGGLPESGHWETGQARMARPAWEDLAGHLESSPVNFIHELETPVLVMHGDQDGVVDFRQGLEYYNYARRAGKPVVMLVYPGADHSLAVEEQQVDYHRRILQWFDHYLKGDPAPSWITNGESWQERSQRIGG